MKDRCAYFRMAGVFIPQGNEKKKKKKKRKSTVDSYNSRRYESMVLTNRIAGKRMNIKKIKLFCIKTKQHGNTCFLYRYRYRLSIVLK